MEQLERLGLNRNEAKIYLALLDLGEAQAGQISKKAQINRTTTYDSVERLIQRGLVTYVIKANKKVFQPVHPTKILEKIKFRYNKEDEGFDDMWFCKDLRESGIKLYCDTSLKCKHLIKDWSWKNIKK